MMANAKLIFELTNLCNFHCVHCIRDEDGPKNFLDPELVARILEEAKAYGAFGSVAFSGGEPTLHPEFGRLVGLAVGAGYRFSFVTNGWKFEQTLSEIEPFKEHTNNVSLSLDGAREETHDVLRRRPGSFRDVVRAVSLCRFHGIPAQINMVVTSANRGELSEMAVLATQLGCTALGFGHCQPTPDGLAANLVLSAEERVRVEAEIADLQRTFRLPIRLAGDHRSESLFYQCPQLQMQELNIDYRGYLTACCTLSNYRGGAVDSDVIADLNQVSLYEGHRRLVRKIAELNEEKIDRLAHGATNAADQFICSHCLRHYRKVADLDEALSVDPATVSQERSQGAPL